MKIVPLSGVLFGVYLLLLIWVPLPLGSNRPWSWHIFECIVFILWGICFYLIKFHPRILSYSKAFEKSGAYRFLFLTFLAILVIQLIPLPEIIRKQLTSKLFYSDSDSIISIDMVTTFTHLRLSLAYFGVVFLTLNLVTNRERLKKLFLVLIISGVFQAFFASLLTFPGLKGTSIDQYINPGSVATGTYWNHNHLANYLMLCLSFGIGYLLSNINLHSSSNFKQLSYLFFSSLLNQKIILRLSLIIMVIALVLTRSRMGNVAFFTSLILTSLIWLFHTKHINTRVIIFLASILIVDLLIVGQWFGITKVAQHLQETSVRSETRDEVNRDVIQLIKTSPILGTGAGTFYTAFPAYRSKDINLYYDHAHNDYAELLSEHGIIGFVILMFLVLISLSKCLKVISTRRSKFIRGLVFAPIMAIMGMLIHSFVDFNLQITSNTAIFLVLITLPWVLMHLPSRSSSKS